MELTTIARRGSAVVASLAAVGLLTLASPSAVHASGARDSDGDGMPNRWEVAHHLNAHRANAKGDPDQDGLKNLGEFRHGTRPHSDDSDDDGVEDGEEVHDGCTSTDPTDSDTDDDGTEDGQEDTDGDGVDNADDETEDNCQGDDDGSDDRLGPLRRALTRRSSTPYGADPAEADAIPPGHHRWPGGRLLRPALGSASSCDGGEPPLHMVSSPCEAAVGHLHMMKL